MRKPLEVSGTVSHDGASKDPAMPNWIAFSLISLAMLQSSPNSPPRELSETLAAVSLNVKESTGQLPG